jgi:hypothetical protein
MDWKRVVGEPSLTGLWKGCPSALASLALNRSIQFPGTGHLGGNIGPMMMEARYHSRPFRGPRADMSVLDVQAF